MHSAILKICSGNTIVFFLNSESRTLMYNIVKMQRKSVQEMLLLIRRL